MPFDRPGITALRDRASAEISSNIEGAEALPRRSNLGVIAKVIAGGLHLLYGFLLRLSNELFEDTASAEILARRAAVWGIVRKAAVAAVGNVDFTGTDGSAIPAQTLLQAADGTEFVSTNAGVIAAGVASIAVAAVETGVVGNRVAGASVTLTSPLAGIDSAAVVGAGGISSGADSESDDRLRERLLDHIRRRPHGGAAFDYEKWGREVPAVTRVFVAPKEQGAGTVVVRFTLDDDPAGPIPNAAKVQEVLDYIEARRPVTADVFVLAPVAVPLDLTIQLTPNNAGVQAAVEAELRDLLLREAAPGATILISHIREAVSIAAGETDNVVSIPAADKTHGTGEMATFGIITWV